MVDSASFNTHSGTAGAELPSAGPSFPSDLPAGPVRFLGATPNERVDVTDSRNRQLQDSKSSDTVAPKLEDIATESTIASDATTVMSAMDKAALDLYAISQGSQKLPAEALVSFRYNYIMALVIQGR